jgi:hypothetical protein
LNRPHEERAFPRGGERWCDEPDEPLDLELAIDAAADARKDRERPIPGPGANNDV